LHLKQLKYYVEDDVKRAE